METCPRLSPRITNSPETSWIFREQSSLERTLREQDFPRIDIPKNRQSWRGSHVQQETQEITTKPAIQEKPAKMPHVKTASVKPEERKREKPAQTVQECPQKRALEKGFREVLETISSLPLEQAGVSGNTMTNVIEIRQEIRPVLALVTSTQERNEDFYRKLLDAQRSIEGAIGDVYRQGIEVEKQGETFLRIWSENIECIRKEQTEIAEAVNSLRHWAQAIQRTGLPQDKSLRNAVGSLARQDLDIRQYLEVNLPLIPGILWYKVQFDINLAKIFLFPLWVFWKLFKAILAVGKSMELSQSQPLAIPNAL